MSLGAIFALLALAFGFPSVLSEGKKLIFKHDPIFKMRKALSLIVILGFIL